MERLRTQEKTQKTEYSPYIEGILNAIVDLNSAESAYKKLSEQYSRCENNRNIDSNERAQVLEALNIAEFQVERFKTIAIRDVHAFTYDRINGAIPFDLKRFQAVCAQ